MLRRHFGISAYAAEHVIPEWELDMLLEGLRREQAATAAPTPPPRPRAQRKPPSTDPWADIEEV